MNFSNLLEVADPFTSDDPFKSDPFAQFKTVSFADRFSSDPFEVEYCIILFVVVLEYIKFNNPISGVI